MNRLVTMILLVVLAWIPMAILLLVFGFQLTIIDPFLILGLFN